MLKNDGLCCNTLAHSAGGPVRTRLPSHKAGRNDLAHADGYHLWLELPTGELA